MNCIISVRTAQKPKNVKVIRDGKHNIRNSKTIPKGVAFMVLESMDIPEGFEVLATRYNENSIK